VPGELSPTRTVGARSRLEKAGYFGSLAEQLRLQSESVARALGFCQFLVRENWFLRFEPQRLRFLFGPAGANITFPGSLVKEEPAGSAEPMVANL
jgi:hypothetical protein